MGPAYGRASAVGLPAGRAIDHGAEDIDTARAYRQSKARLGRILSRGLLSQARILTKFDPMADIPSAYPRCQERPDDKASDTRLASAHDMRRV